MKPSQTNKPVSRKNRTNTSEVIQTIMRMIVQRRLLQSRVPYRAVPLTKRYRQKSISVEVLEIYLDILYLHAADCSDYRGIKTLLILREMDAIYMLLYEFEPGKHFE